MHGECGGSVVPGTRTLQTLPGLLRSDKHAPQARGAAARADPKKGARRGRSHGVGRCGLRGTAAGAGGDGGGAPSARLTRLRDWTEETRSR